jgi:hypothetical protein
MKMKKIYNFLFGKFPLWGLGGFSFLWFLGCSGDLTHLLSQKGIIKDDYRYGDLYRLSNLPQFRVPIQKCETKPIEKIKNTHLILLGDSFTEEGRIGKENFITDGFQRFFVAADTNIAGLKINEKNILVIETVERHLRERFKNNFRGLSILNNKGNRVPPIPSGGEWKGWAFPYNKERHESALFSSDFFLQFKEWKAWINWKFFNRTDSLVAVTDDGKCLLYGTDVQKGINSCFDNISEEEINQIVKNINESYNFYKKQGFNEVYLTICPNKTSIYAQNVGEYNHLIERIQNHKDLKMPFIDVYTPIKNSQKMLYDIGDTHWNCEGKQIWIDSLNERMKNIL